MTMRIAIVWAFFSVLLALAFGPHAASAGQKVAPKNHYVVIKGFKFEPEKLELEVGDTVTWTNEDIVPHIVTTDKFESKSMDQGESWSFKAKHKGDFPYFCRFHPTMKAELVVH